MPELLPLALLVGSALLFVAFELDFVVAGLVVEAGSQAVLVPGFVVLVVGQTAVVAAVAVAAEEVAAAVGVGVVVVWVERLGMLLDGSSLIGAGEVLAGVVWWVVLDSRSGCGCSAENVLVA